MGRYRITRHLRATPEQTFRAFTDPTLVADWLDAIAVADPTGPLGVAGTRYRLVIRGPWQFRTEVVRSEPPWLHETVGRAPLGGAYRLVASLTESADGGTVLDLLTEYTIPLGPIGRWIDRRWVDKAPRATANREVDRLVEIVSEPASREAVGHVVG